jgi:hypothetical protein
MKNATKKLILTKKGEVSKTIINAINNCKFNLEDRKIYTGYYSGSGRFTSRHSAQSTITSILTAQGYKFELGNDSDRGGASGEYVKMSKKAINFIESI